jgi:hypothetical protein
MTGEHLVDFDDEVVVVNAKPPAGWRLIDGPTGRVDIAAADVSAVIRSWRELERQWRETQ